MISPLSKIEFYKFHLTHKIWFQRCQKMNYFFNQISTAVVRIRKLNKWNHVDGTWHLIPTCLAPQNTIDYYSKTHEGVHALGNGKFKRWIFLALFQPFSWRLPSLPAPPPPPPSHGKALETPVKENIPFVFERSTFKFFLLRTYVCWFMRASQWEERQNGHTIPFPRLI